MSPDDHDDAGVVVFPRDADADPYDADDPAPVSGLVADAGRGAWPFRLVHGESLVAAAAWAMGEAGVELVDATIPLSAVVERDEVLVVHDPLCPMTPPAFIAACAARAGADDVVVVGVRDVTDTVKVVDGTDDDAQVGATVPREDLVGVCAPLVLPPSVLADWVEQGGGAALVELPFAILVATLRERLGADRVVLAPAPPTAMRIGDDADLLRLEALTAPR